MRIAIICCLLTLSLPACDGEDSSLLLNEKALHGTWTETRCTLMTTDNDTEIDLTKNNKVVFHQDGFATLSRDGKLEEGGSYYPYIQQRENYLYFMLVNSPSPSEPDIRGIFTQRFTQVYRVIQATEEKLTLRTDPLLLRDSVTAELISAELTWELTRD